MTYKELEKCKSYFINQDIEIHHMGHSMSLLLKATVKNIMDDGSIIRIITNVGIIRFDLEMSSFNGNDLGQNSNSLMYITLLKQHSI